MSTATIDPVDDLHSSSETPFIGARQQFVRRLRRERPAIVAFGFLVAITLLAIATPLLAPHDPLSQNLRNVLASPSSEHWLGTDSLGRDVLSRMLFASRISLLAAFVAVGVGGVIGISLGVIAGYAGGKLDRVVMFANDVAMAFPTILLAIALIAALGRSTANALLAIGLIFVPRFIRISRSAVLNVRRELYLDASRTIGTSTWWRIRRHVLPNILSPLLVLIALSSGFAMLAEASLSFLGLGVQPPAASWGSMLGEGARQIPRQRLLVIWPGAAISLSVLAFNLLGDGLRDAAGRSGRGR